MNWIQELERAVPAALLDLLPLRGATGITSNAGVPRRQGADHRRAHGLNIFDCKFWIF